jgi:hypothetical protein
MSAPCPVFGFIVRVAPRAESNDDAASRLCVEFIKVLDVNGLTTDRGERRAAYLVSREGGQATQADRELVLAWASRWTQAAAITVSDLMDLSQVA